jgi:hypothetical protein
LVFLEELQKHCLKNYRAHKLNDEDAFTGIRLENTLNVSQVHYTVHVQPQATKPSPDQEPHFISPTLATRDNTGVGDSRRDPQLLLLLTWPGQLSRYSDSRRLHCPRIESQWGRGFPQQSTPTLGPAHPPTNTKCTGSLGA